MKVFHSGYELLKFLSRISLFMKLPGSLTKEMQGRFLSREIFFRSIENISVRVEQGISISCWNSLIIVPYPGRV
jgi:hypothetical protein